MATPSGTQGTPNSPARSANSARRQGAQPAKANRGQEYGKAGEQIQSQKSVPLRKGGGGPKPQPRPGPGPGQVIPLEQPSLRPDEPVTSGLSIGPGAGPSAMHSMASTDPELGILRALFGRSRSPHLQRLIEWVENNPENPNPSPVQAPSVPAIPLIRGGNDANLRNALTGPAPQPQGTGQEAAQQPGPANHPSPDQGPNPPA